MSGGRDAILLLHGLYGNPLEMQYIGRKLQRAGYAVEIPYIHGCGVADTRSPRQTTPWENWLEQVDAHFRIMQRTYEHVSVAGLCIGADLALALALEHSADIHALCLYSTTLYYDGWNVSRLRFLRALAYYTPLRYMLSYHERHPYGLKDERIRQWVAKQMEKGVETPAGAARSPFTGVYQAERMMRHLRRNLHRITAPTLILHALEDDFASPRSADLVESRVSSPTVRKVILQDSYHIITLDNDKERVARETLDFMAAQTGKTSQTMALAA
ncbi:MAG: alpha/beta fold hydrolase [Sulfuricella sp.]